MGTGEAPVGTDPSDITDEMLQSARRRAWELDLRPSASAATIAGALDWLRENPAELARLLGWGYTLSTADDGHTQVDVLANVRSQY
jgi:hypothetical protein